MSGTDNLDVKEKPVPLVPSAVVMRCMIELLYLYVPGICGLGLVFWFFFFF